MIKLFCIFLLCLTTCISSLCLAQAEKYERAIVFSGGRTNIAIFLGMLAAAEEKGFKPDVIIGSCGGSVAAAIASTYPTTKARLDYIQSDEFYNAIHKPAFNGITKIGLTLQEYKDSWTTGRIPNLFDNTMASVPQTIDLPSLNKAFPAGMGPKVVVVAGELVFGRERIGEKMQPGEKLYQEVFFTDEDTAKKLKGFNTPVADFPGSRVYRQTDVTSKYSMTQSMRASFADLYFIKPAHLGENDFVTGGIDLQPLEVAKKLAKKVMMTDSPTYAPYEIAGLQTTFNVNGNDRECDILNKNASYWVNFSDYTDQKFAFGAKDLGSSRKDFSQRVLEQWKFGYQRALEALNKSEGSRDHIPQWKDCKPSIPTSVPTNATSGIR
jgi:predicted acylesterase/phospholipase RssA